MSSGISGNPAALKRLRKRYREEGRFRAYGLSAIVFAIFALVVLLVSIVGESISAFTKHELSINVLIDPAIVDPSGRRDPAVLTKNVSAFSDLFRDELKQRFPEAGADLALRRQLNRMVSTLAGQNIAHRAAANPQLIGQTTSVVAPVSDVIDLYLKGLITDERIMKGSVAASLSRAGGEVTIRAPGGFAVPYADMAERLREEATGKSDAAAVSQTAIDRANARLQELTARRTEIAAADAARIRTETEDYIVSGEEDDIGLVRAAGAIAGGAELASLRGKLAARLEAEAVEADKQADELVGKGASFANKAAEAESNGEPTAETRRIQAETAYLAGDRRRVDAALFRDASGKAPQMSAADMMAAISLLTGRPLAPLGVLAAAPEVERKPAVITVNAAELVAAEAALADQAARIARLQQEAATLKADAPKRAAAIEKTAIPAAKSRLARLTRERDARQEARARLGGVATPVLVPAAPAPAAAGQPAAPPEPAAPSVDEATFVATERVAQLGLDLGGPLAAAFELGAAEGGVPGADSALKSLMVAHADLDIEAARRDVERLTRKRDRDTQLANTVLARLATSGASIEPDEFSPSLLVEINGGVVKAGRVSPDEIAGEILIPPTGDSAAAGQWRVRELKVAEADRLVTDRQAAWANALKASGDIRSVINFDLLTKSDSTYPELAGLAAALAGSFWIMAVTLLLSLPIGVAAAIYLEEFAPRNGITDFIEVNINNLAAVPSIVFGLLGAAVFINFFDLPRSAPLVGGLVLSLITLPTIIIATRAALGAVPPSIREGALAVGASLPQTVFHHVLPLAAPGILTGAIIGLARALGETAPLLLIGMVAFVADPPDGPLDSATALPVLVYKWSSAAERAWQPMTSASIIVLLVFMFAMNALAVYLRRKLERRW